MDTSLIHVDATPLAKLLVLILVTAFLVFQCYRLRSRSDADVRRLQKLARPQLEILQQASKDVSNYVFPKSGFVSWCTKIFSAEKAERCPFASASELQQLLNQIRPPAETKGSQHTYHVDRLCVLGSALWFRFSYQGGFSKDDFTTLCQALTTKKPIREPDSEEVSAFGIGLPFMKDTLLWAIFPHHRETLSYCLDVLAWALRVPDGHLRPSLPMELLVMLVQEIMQAQQFELLPDSSQNGSDYQDGSREPLLPSKQTATTEDEEVLTARRIFDYLHQLNVFNLSYNTPDKDDTHVAPEAQAPCFMLRSGILEPPAKFRADNQSWIEPFINKLSLLVDESTNTHLPAIDSLQDAAEESDSPSQRRRFLLQHLPALMIHLQSLQEATQLLCDEESLIVSRLEQLGLKVTVRAYVSEWQSLQQALRLSLQPDVFIVKSPVFDGLCAETLSTSAPMTQPTNNADGGDKLQQQESSAFACNQLGSFALDQTNDPGAIAMAVQLFHQGRHLQLLSLEGHCRQVAKTIHNLALTLHVRENNRRGKKKERTVVANSSSNQSVPSEDCFYLSSQLREAIKKDYQGQKDEVGETTVEVLAIALCGSLLKVWSDLQPIFAQVKGDANNNSAPDGVQFRINRVTEHFRSAQESSQSFADLQSKLSKFNCTERKAQATRDLLEAVDSLEAVGR